MAAREVVNLMVSYQADVHRRESEEFYTQHQDAQGDRAALLDEVDTLRRYLSSLCTTHEQERVKARQALDRPEAYNKALKAQITVLETQAYRHEWQRQDAYDHATGHIIRIQALETGARVDTLEEIDFTSVKPKKRTATTTTTTTPMTDAQLKVLIAQGVVDALAEIEANKTSRNGDDSHDSGTGSRRTKRPARVVSLTQWFEKMESVFHISNCTVACQIKYATCTLQGNALTWWNSHVKTVTHEVAYAMAWKTLKKMMTDKYYPRGEIKKLEIKKWNMKVKVTDVVSYNQCFQELSLMCSRMFPEESDEIEKYVGGLPDMIHVSVMTSKPKTMQDAIDFATELMDQKIHTLGKRQAKNKRKFEDTSRNNQNQQQPFKRHNVAQAYTTGPGEKKPYGGSKPLCLNCNYHHDGQCALKCTNFS
ncbi:reverse transcriptase domain-containing protein [Tanacetum coccineum]